MFCCSVQLFTSNMGPQVLRHSGTLLIENISNKKLLVTCPLPFTRETGLSSTEINKWGGEKRSSRLTCSFTLAKEEIYFLLNTSFIPWPSKLYDSPFNYRTSGKNAVLICMLKRLKIYPQDAQLLLITPWLTVKIWSLFFMTSCLRINLCVKNKPREKDLTLLLLLL